jgi:arylsulfatase A-like enzyme
MRILVLHAGALHPGYIGCYGCDWVDTPNLDRLAAEGVVFDRHYADSPVLRDDHASHFTGRQRFPSPSGQTPASDFPTLPEILRTHGIHPLILDLAEQQAGDFPAKKLGRWLRGDDALCWINCPSLSPPWEVPEEFLAAYFPTVEEEEPLLPWLDPPAGPFDDFDRERLQSTYAARMSFFDAQVGMALEQMERAGDVLICVMSSSGLALGEHGHVGSHRAWLHEEIVHVPLILRLPNAAEAGLRVPALTQPVDLLPTILAALDLPPVEAHGFDLLPLVRGELEQVRPYACSGLAIGDSIEWSVRTPEWAYLLPLATPPHDPPRLPQLFVKPDDRWEVSDVRQHHLELADQLERDLRSFVAGVGSP